MHHLDVNSQNFPRGDPRNSTCQRVFLSPTLSEFPFRSFPFSEASSFNGHFCPPPRQWMFWIRPVNNRGYILSICVFPRSSVLYIWRVLVDFVYIWKIWHSNYVIRFILPAKIISNQKGLHEVDNEKRCQYSINCIIP